MVGSILICSIACGMSTVEDCARFCCLVTIFETGDTPTPVIQRPSCITGGLSIDDAKDGIKMMMIDRHNVFYTCLVAY